MDMRFLPESMNTVSKVFWSISLIVVCMQVDENLQYSESESAIIGSVDSTITIVAYPGWSEGYLDWDCKAYNCAWYPFVPHSGPGSWGYWPAGPLPLNHYYWWGSVTVFECAGGKWFRTMGIAMGYFNHDPRQGDQSAVEGGDCGYIKSNNFDGICLNLL